MGQLQRALAKRDVLAVRSLAGELPQVLAPLLPPRSRCSSSSRSPSPTFLRPGGCSVGLRLSERCLYDSSQTSQRSWLSSKRSGD